MKQIMEYSYNTDIIYLIQCSMPKRRLNQWQLGLSNKPLHSAIPPFAASLFNSTTWSLLWLVVRVYVGYKWLESGLGKLSNPAWAVTGEALKGFWTRAVMIPEAPARPAISFDWYRAFLQTLLDSGSYVWFSKLVMVGEILIGIAPDPGHLYRHRGLLWRLYELELYDGRHRQHQPGTLLPLDPADPGLEDGWMVGPGPLDLTGNRHPLAARQGIFKRYRPVIHYSSKKRVCGRPQTLF